MVRRILLLLSVAALLAAMVVASAMPAFAQGRGEGAQGKAVGPEGGNPGIGLARIQEADRTVGANDLKPLPFGGQTSEVLPGGSEAGFNNAPQALFVLLQVLLSIHQAAVNSQ